MERQLNVQAEDMEPANGMKGNKKKVCKFLSSLKIVFLYFTISCQSEERLSKSLDLS
jgi:hypothetical protein